MKFIETLQELLTLNIHSIIYQYLFILFQV